MARQILLILLITLSIGLRAQTSDIELVEFKSSECLSSEETPLKFDYEKKADSLIVLKLKIYTNCCFNQDYGVRTSTDTLFLIYGSVYTIDSVTNDREIDVCTCNCNFNFEYHIKNVSKDYNIVLRNEGFENTSKIIGRIEL